MPPTLYLIDGHALAYRMYFALTSGGASNQRWQTSKGEPTAGTYGFARELMRILENENLREFRRGGGISSIKSWTKGMTSKKFLAAMEALKE